MPFCVFLFSHEKEKRKAYARHDITGRRKGDPQSAKMPMALSGGCFAIILTVGATIFARFRSPIATPEKRLSRRIFTL